MTAAPQRVKGYTLNARITAETRAALEAEAKRTGRSLSAVAELWLELARRFDTGGPRAMKLNVHHTHDIRLGFSTPLRVQVVEPPPEPSGAVWITAKPDGGFTITAKGPHMAYTLADGLQVNLKVQYVDAEGNPAKVDGDPTWETSNPEVATITPTPGNPLIANLLAVSLGSTQVTVTADADLGEGVTTLTCFLDVEVIAGEAVAGTISPAGEPAPPSPGGPGRR